MAIDKHTLHKGAHRFLSAFICIEEVLCGVQRP
jgi:hypothetical protein